MTDCVHSLVRPPPLLPVNCIWRGMQHFGVTNLAVQPARYTCTYVHFLQCLLYKNLFPKIILDDNYDNNYSLLRSREKENSTENTTFKYDFSWALINNYICIRSSSVMPRRLLLVAGQKQNISERSSI
jgi:hypothetical protein